MRPAGSGLVLVIVLVIMAILAITGMGLLSLSLDGYRRAIHVSDEVAARSAAEAGVARALFAMKSYNGVDLPSATNEPVPECGGTFSYAVTLGSPDGYVVDAAGIAGNATKTVRARLMEQNLFCGIAVRQSAVIATSARVLPEAGSHEPQLATNSTTAGAVNLDASTIAFQGDVVVGPGGDPAAVVVGEQVVSGMLSAAARVMNFPAVTPPVDLPFRGEIKGTTTVTENGRYDRIRLIGTAKTLTVQGHVTLYVTGDVELRNFSKITVTQGSSLVLYVGGDITIQHGALMRDVDHDPTQVLILGTNSCTQIDLLDGVLLYVGLYAPAANVHLRTSAEIHGAFACNTLNPMWKQERRCTTTTECAMSSCLAVNEATACPSGGMTDRPTLQDRGISRLCRLRCSGCLAERACRGGAVERGCRC